LEEEERLLELAERVRKLKLKGLSTEEIAGEFNISHETVIWLLTKEVSKPKDVLVEWNNIGKNPERLETICKALVDLMYEELDKKPELAVGIETSGVPMATLISRQLGIPLGIIRPKGRGLSLISRNFSSVRGKNLVIVDDVITTGETMKGAVSGVKKEGGNPIACLVLIDKKGIEEIEGVPVLSLFRLIRL